MTFFIIGISLMVFIVFVNVLLFYFFIQSAIHRIVKPELQRNNLIYINHKWTGFWSCGDFKYDTMDFALFKSGLNTLSIYAYLYYKDSDDIKKATIKINTIGFEVNKVEFSNSLK